MPTQHHRIQVTEDPELARALAAARPYLAEGLSSAGELRALALIGARHVADARADDERQAMLRDRFAKRFEDPERSGIDWEVARNLEHLAWRGE